METKKKNLPLRLRDPAAYEKALVEHRAWSKRNREKLRLQKIDWLSRQTPEKIEWLKIRRNESVRKHFKNPANRAKLALRQKIYKESFPDRVSATKKKYRDANKEKARAYYQANADRIRARIRDRSQTPEARAKRNAEMVARKQIDVHFKILKTLRSRMGSVVKFQGVRKAAKTVELIGCSIEFLRAHLQSKFKPGMAWNNHGVKGWHIDHIRPCESFDLTLPEEQFKCFHWTNLQPLWWMENLTKAKRYEEMSA